MTEDFIALKGVPIVLNSFLSLPAPLSFELSTIEIPQGTTIVCEVINPLSVIMQWEDKTHEITSDTFQLLILLKFLEKK
mgnify:CR=1 FL=1